MAVTSLAWQGNNQTMTCRYNHHLVNVHARHGLASSPGLLIGGRGREGLVSTACTCAVIMQILNNLIMQGYYLVYLPFDLNSSRSMYLEITGWTVHVSSMEHDFKVAQETLSCRFMRASKQSGHAFSTSVSAKARRSSRILQTYGQFHLSAGLVYRHFYGK